MHKIFDFRHNKDFRTDPTREGTHLARRGGVLYREPCGFKRFGIRVAGKYDGGDDSWLNDWAVAYHGCPMKAVSGIMESGFMPGTNQGGKGCIDVRDGEEIGSGIYCSPNLQVVECYANGEEGYNQDGTPKGEACTLDGHTVLFVLMCRVKPAAIRRPDRHYARCNDEEVMGIDGTFEWVIHDPANIRPYAVLIREKVPGCHRDLVDLVKSFNTEHKPLEKGTFDNIPGADLDPHHSKVAASYEKAVRDLSHALRPAFIGAGVKTQGES